MENGIQVPLTLGYSSLQKYIYARQASFTELSTNPEYFHVKTKVLENTRWTLKIKAEIQDSDKVNQWQVSAQYMISQIDAVLVQCVQVPVGPAQPQYISCHRSRVANPCPELSESRVECTEYLSFRVIRRLFWRRPSNPPDTAIGGTQSARFVHPIHYVSSPGVNVVMVKWLGPKRPSVIPIARNWCRRWAKRLSRTWNKLDIRNWGTRRLGLT